MALSILSKDNSPQGVDYYRDADTSVAPAYRPTIKHECKMNRTGSNSNVNIKITVPVVNDVNGQKTSKDSFSLRIHFNSLQEVNAEAEREKAINYAIGFLTKAKESIKSGVLPDEPLDLASL